MGGRSSKITVTQLGGTDLPPTDAAILKALGSEYANSKQRASGKVAWDYQEYAACNKDRDSNDVILVDRESAGQPHEISSTSATGKSPTAPSDKAQAQGQAQLVIVDKACKQEAGAVANVSPSGSPSPELPATGTSRTGGKQSDSHTKSPLPASGCNSPTAVANHKQRRPPTGNPKHVRESANDKHNMNHPSGQSPKAVAAAAATVAAAGTAAVAGAVAAAAAATAAAANGDTRNSVVDQNTTARGKESAATAAAPPSSSVAGRADAAAATHAGAAAAASPNSPSAAAAAAAGGPVQWVIRPGPPIESAYKLGKVLGQGSFGVVRAATHIATGAEVAVKTIRKSLLRAADITALRREVEILHHLAGHPHISQLLGVYEEPRQLHLVLELYKGGDLFDAIIGSGRHSERTAADVLRTVLKALAYCHSMGVAHRDIKPENFMLTAELPKDFQDKQAPPQPPQPPPQQATSVSSGSRQIPRAMTLVGIGSRLKLIDFGLSTFCTDDTPLTDVVGTSYYVAPEVLEGRYSLPADVWSVGVILHIMLTGYAPFDGRDDREILRAVRKGNLDLTKDPVWKSISSEAIAVLMAMLERDPKKRATADQVLSMPWLGRTADICAAPTTQLPGVVSERMHRFARMSSFKKEARRVVAGLMRPEEVAGLVAQFQGLDADRDGRISLAELREGLIRQSLLRGELPGPSPLDEEHLQELMRRSDLNGDGLLDESEFLGAALPVAALARQLALTKQAAIAAAAAGGEGGVPRPTTSLSQPPNALEAAFKYFDTDGSGFITAGELRKALATHHPSGKSVDVEAVLSRHDRDADGRISYPEFVDMLVQDVDDEGADMYDHAVHGRRQLQPVRRGDVKAAVTPGSARIISGSGGDDGASRTLHDSAPAWDIRGVEPGIPMHTTAAAAAAAGKTPSPDAGAIAGSCSSTAAARLTSSRMSPLEWSDECAGGTDDEAVAPAAAPAPAVAAARQDTAPASGSRSRMPSRLSQPQLQPSLPSQQQQRPGENREAPASTSTPQVALCGGSGGANHRATVGGYNPFPSDAGESGSGGLYRMAEVPDVSDNDGELYGVVVGVGSGGTSLPAQRPTPRAPPPPRLQLPVQPRADARDRRHSAGGTVYDVRALLPTGSRGSGSGSGGSPLTHADIRPSTPVSRLRPGNRGSANPRASLDMTLGYNYNDLQAIARTAIAAGGGGGGGVGVGVAAVSLPGSPSTAAAVAAAQRVMAGRLSPASTAVTAAVAVPPPPPPQQLQQQQQRQPPLQQLQQSSSGTQATLRAPQAQRPGSPAAFDLLTERASCPLTKLDVGWPPSPAGGGGGGAARPSRATATGVYPGRTPAPPWPATAATAAAALRPAPPSEPLPLLHITGMGSRRQSTGSPAWPLLHGGGGGGGASGAGSSAGSGAASPQPLSAHPQQQYPPNQYYPQQLHNMSISCNGGGSSNGSSHKMLSPRVPAVTSADWPGGGASGAATPTAGRRSRRTTQPGMMLPAYGEDLIITSRASVELDPLAVNDVSLGQVALPPGSTGLGSGAPYRPSLTTSASGRLP